MLCVPFATSVPALCEEAVVAIGKQRAGASAIAWDVRDVNHPLLGPIKAAVQRNAIATPARSEKILSLAFVSCQKSTGKVALELASAPESDARGGLGPVDLPRLVCNKPRPDGVLAKEDLAASWEIGALGDTLARGLSPAALRRCVSIDVLQNVALPPGSPQQSLRVALELTPYGKELDAIFTACGEKTAYLVEAPSPSAQAPVGQPTLAAQAAPNAQAAPVEQTAPVVQTAPQPRSNPVAGAAEGPWTRARTIGQGRTNIRKADTINSAVVIQLDSGAVLLVQPTSAQWWKVKPRSGTAFSGYVRRDRVVLE